MTPRAPLWAHRRPTFPAPRIRTRPRTRPRLSPGRRAPLRWFPSLSLPARSPLPWRGCASAIASRRPPSLSRGSHREQPVLEDTIRPLAGSRRPPASLVAGPWVCPPFKGRGPQTNSSLECALGSVGCHAHELCRFGTLWESFLSWCESYAGLIVFPMLWKAGLT